jgi:arylsulfatase
MPQSRQFLFALLLLLAVCASVRAQDEPRPNIVLVLADDLGFSDIGAFGGEIRTPNLDSLAERGLRLTNYHTGATCGPTRAMLMTGVDHHRAGLGTNAVSLRRLPELRERPGYEGRLNDSVVTFATLLKSSGYHTFMTGKWDLGGKPGMLPTDRGFDRFFGIPAGGASHFSDAIGTFRPVANAVYLEDNRQIEQLPDDFYTSTSYTERLLKFIDERPGDGEPYFAYLALTAPHWPLQVPDDWIDRYKGAYDEGWHVIRQRRFERQLELGLIPADSELPAQNRAVADWETLSPAQRQVELKRMEIYAAMIELLDQEVGRLIDAVSANDDRETIILFLSDNGSEGNDIGILLDNAYWIPATFDNRLDNMGRRGSYVWLGAGWGQATASPFRNYKSYMTEGGIRAPGIAFSTTGRFGNGRQDALVTVMDIAPTFLDIAGVKHPASAAAGDTPLTMNGVSALPLLSGSADTVHGDAPIGWELYGNRALLMGDWKAVLIWPPEGDGQWSLFDMASDPTETRNLATTYPDRLADMIGQWDAYAEQNGVALFDEDLGYGRYKDPANGGQ